MPALRCPKCDEIVKAPRVSEGKRPKCPSCRSVLQPADGEKGRPRKKRADENDETAESPRMKKGRSKAKKKSVSLGLMIGLAVGGAVLLIGLVACVVFMVTSGGAGKRVVEVRGGGAGTTAAGANDLKSAIVGKWISSHSIRLKDPPGKEAYIQFDAKGQYSMSPAGQGESGSYKVLDDGTLELTHSVGQIGGVIVGVPVGATTTTVPDTIENGKIVKRGYTLSHQKWTARMPTQDRLELTPQGGVSVTQFYERAGAEKKAAE